MRVWVPGTPGTPGTPATIDETNKTGWSSGAVSIPILTGNGGYEFFVPASVVGVVCGLADQFAGIGYRTIDHALYFSRGTMVLMEFGNTVEELGSYGSSDKFVMWRQGADVFVSQNGVLIARRPSTLDASFRLASSLYLKGDTIVNAKVAAIVPAVGSGGGTFGPLTSLGMQGANSFGASTVGPFEGAAGAENHANGGGHLEGVRALASNKPYAGGSGALGPFSGYAEGAVAAPSWALGDGYLGGMSTYGHSFTGAVGTGDAALRRVQARGSDRAYGAGEGELGEVFAFGAQAVTISLGLLTLTDPYVLQGAGSEGSTDGLQADLPAIVMAGAFGAQARLHSASVVLTADGVFMPVLRGTLTSPAPTLEASGTVSNPAQAELALAGRFNIAGVGGAQARLMGPRLEMGAAGVTGGAATGNLVLLGHYALVGEGVVQEANIWAVTGPALQAAPSGQAWLVAPSLVLAASGGDLLAASYEAYAINLSTGAVTRYTEFPFDNVLRFGDRFFGIKSDGVFELAGDSDNGAAIQARIETFGNDFGTASFKRVPWVHLVGRLETRMSVSFSANEGTPYSYPSAGAYDGCTCVHRAKMGAGLRGTRYAFTFENTDGGNFELEHVEAVVDILARGT